jgi:hypothetical protein
MVNFNTALRSTAALMKAICSGQIGAKIMMIPLTAASCKRQRQPLPRRNQMIREVVLRSEGRRHRKISCEINLLVLETSRMNIPFGDATERFLGSDGQSLCRPRTHLPLSTMSLVCFFTPASD